MDDQKRLILWGVLGGAWVGLSGWQLWGVSAAAKRLMHAHEALDAAAQKVEQNTERLHAVMQETQRLHRDYEFLQSLLNVLPQEKGFARTQRAMSREIEQLRLKVGRRLRQDLHLLVDTQANKLYVKRGLTLLWQADCSVGKGGTLIDQKTGRRWEFVTPRGVFDIREKVEKPVWTKPDWAFVETGEDIPPPQDPKRRAEGELGGYVLNLGDGYLIHGTKNEAMLGRPASHGCVRLAAADLERLYKEVPRGARVYIY